MAISGGAMAASSYAPSHAPASAASAASRAPHGPSGRAPSKLRTAPLASGRRCTRVGSARPARARWAAI
eukprot:1322493-Alexandrium_andersonii.AAC.1